MYYKVTIISHLLSGFLCAVKTTLLKNIPSKSQI